MTGHTIPQTVIYNEILHTSRASHDRHLQAAIRRLAGQVLAKSVSLAASRALLALRRRDMRAAQDEASHTL